MGQHSHDRNITNLYNLAGVIGLPSGHYITIFPTDRTTNIPSHLRGIFIPSKQGQTFILSRWHLRSLLFRKINVFQFINKEQQNKKRQVKKYLLWNVLECEKLRSYDGYELVLLEQNNLNSYLQKYIFCWIRYMSD